MGVVSLTVTWKTFFCRHGESQFALFVVPPRYVFHQWRGRLTFSPDEVGKKPE